MTHLQEFLQSTFYQKMTMTLGHFFWQGIAIGVVFALLQPLWRNRSASSRYIFNLSFFILLAALPAITFCLVEVPSPHETLSSVTSVHEGTIPPSPVTTVVPQQNEGSFSIPVAAETSLLSNWIEVARPNLFLSWLVGVTFLFMRLFLSVISLRILSRSHEPLPAWSLQHLERISRKLGIASFTRAFSSSRIDDACAIGWFQPMILIPAAWLTNMPPHILEAVLAHELAHIKRWDNWVNGFQRLVEAVLFFHPVVWWISHRVRSERELCCDECAAAILQQKVEYAEALEFIARANTVSKNPLLASAIGGRKMLLLRRVKHVLGLQPEKKSGGIWTPLVAVLAVVAMLVVATSMNRSATADDNQKPKDSKSNVAKDVKDAAPVVEQPQSRRPKRQEIKTKRKPGQFSNKRKVGAGFGERPQNRDRFGPDFDRQRRFDGTRGIDGTTTPLPNVTRQGQRKIFPAPKMRNFDRMQDSSKSPLDAGGRTRFPMRKVEGRFGRSGPGGSPEGNFGNRRQSGRCGPCGPREGVPGNRGQFGRRGPGGPPEGFPGRGGQFDPRGQSGPPGGLPGTGGQFRRRSPEGKNPPDVAPKLPQQTGDRRFRGPAPDADAQLLEVIRALRKEVEQLRKEVGDLKGHKNQKEHEGHEGHETLPEVAPVAR